MPIQANALVYVERIKWLETTQFSEFHETFRLLDQFPKVFFKIWQYKYHFKKFYVQWTLISKNLYHTLIKPLFKPWLIYISA